MNKRIQIATISDLHGKHNNWYDNMKCGEWEFDLKMQYEDSDILIFAGDCSSSGTELEITKFFKWFNEQPQKHKIMIAGNHDFLFEENPQRITELLKNYPDIIYLNDSGIKVMGLNIWGSPIQPAFNDWAFNRKRGTDINKHWELIPENTDVLITHGPPRYILDRVEPRFEMYNEVPNVGCDDLANRIEQIKPKLVVFGHIHEGYGKVIKDGITYINASSLTSYYTPINPPMFEVIYI
jgi:Icc-related predicted phosphoesterase